MPEPFEDGSLAPGTRVGDFVVEAGIGGGGMARVYRVRHRILDTLHALKVLEPGYRVNPDARQRFLEEARIQSKHLDHPNVVKVTGIVADQQVAALVMELIDGPTLDHHIGNFVRPPSGDQVRALMLPILAGVGHAHAKGIVHRDIKPLNILLARDASGGWIPKVTDFGIAKVLEGAPGGRSPGKRSTHRDARMGTLSYMSPEQIRSSKDVTPRSDIFSLGAVLYELATGSVAFEAESEYDLMRMIVEGKYEPPERRMAGIDPGIVAVIATALRPDPEARPATCEAFARALLAPPTEVRSTRSTPPRSPSPGHGAPAAGAPEPSARRPEPAVRAPAPAVASGKRRGAAAVVFTGLSVLVGLAWYGVRPMKVDPNPAPPQPQPPVSPQPDPVPPPSLRTQAVGFFSGEAGVVDEARALTLFQQADNQGDPLARMWLARSRHFGFLGLSADPAAATKQAESVIPAVLDLAENNDPEAAFLMASAYQEGLGVTKDSDKAAQLNARACVRGFPLGCNNLGVNHYNAKSFTKAAEFYERACRGSVQRGCVNLGTVLELGRGRPQDFDEAMHLYQGACDKGFGDGCFKLATLYATGPRRVQAPAKAAPLLEPTCKGGHADSCTLLGYLVEGGHAAAEDPAKAQTLYEQACTDGSTFACNHSGLRARAIAYYTGTMFSADEKLARTLFQRAADGGDVLAKSWLARAHSLGRLGLPPDVEQGKILAEEAFEQVEEAANKDDPEAQFLLAVAYELKLGVEVDDQVKASKLYRRSCNAGFLLACANLGFKRLNDDSAAPKDPTEAVKLFEKACEGGLVQGCYYLGVQYQAGDGVAADPGKAVGLFEQTCDKGFSLACGRLQRPQP